MSLDKKKKLEFKYLHEEMCFIFLDKVQFRSDQKLTDHETRRLKKNVFHFI